jgi:hypothetical protein
MVTTVAALLAGCGNSGPVPSTSTTAAALPPAAGKAAAIVVPTANDGGFSDTEAKLYDSDANGSSMTAMAGGGVLIARDPHNGPLVLQKIDTVRREFVDRIPASDPGYANDRMAHAPLLSGSDGGLVTVAGGEITRQPQPGKPWVSIAGRGCTDNCRTVGNPVPASAPADQVTFSRALNLIGETADSTLMISDGDVVWSLSHGTLTRKYVAPAGSRISSDNSFVGSTSPDGHIAFTAPSPRGGTTNGPAWRFLLRDTQTISPSGVATPVSVPSSIAGVAGDPRGLVVVNIISDGGSGFFYRVGDPYPGPNEPNPAAPTHSYVLHQVGDKWSVVAAANGSIDQQTAAKWTASETVDATAIPVQLPTSMAVVPGMLVLSDGVGCDYALAVGLPH